ncbi:MAG: isochorismatase family protein [Planctomycetota bacterium]|nr:isochorismatase family protein [Planctomycetota bacterium]
MNDPETRPPRSNQLLSKTASRLVVVDVQQKLLDHIPVAESLVENCRRLVRGAQLLDVPVAATEQYPAGLGPTTQVLSELLDEIPEKLRFSCAECLDWGPADEGQEQRDQVVVCGIEAHVCVLQTALDLAAQGFRVFVPADAVASRHKLDWKTALGRLADSGVVVLTTESVLFEWCEVAGTDEFRQISRLVTGKDKA